MMRREPNKNGEEEKEEKEEKKKEDKFGTISRQNENGQKKTTDQQLVMREEKSAENMSQCYIFTATLTITHGSVCVIMITQSKIKMKFYFCLQEFLHKKSSTFFELIV